MLTQLNSTPVDEMVQYAFYIVVLLLGWALQQLWIHTHKRIEEFSVELASAESKLDGKVDTQGKMLHDRLSAQAKRISDLSENHVARLAALEANVSIILSMQSSIERKIDTLLMRRQMMDGGIG